MKATVELSLYPLHRNYKEQIKEFISTLESYDEIKVEPNGVSTQIFGEYDRIMDIVKEENRAILEGEQAVLIMKVGKGELRYEE